MSAVEPVVIFGVESSFAPEAIETLRKLGRGIAGSVIAGPPEWEMEGVSPSGIHDVDHSLLARDTVVPWITPGLKWQKVRQAMEIGFSRFPALVDPAAGHASSTRMERGVFLNGGVTIGAYAELGEFVVVNRNASIGHHSVLGAWVSVGPGAAIGNRVALPNRKRNDGRRRRRHSARHDHRRELPRSRRRGGNPRYSRPVACCRKSRAGNSV